MADNAIVVNGHPVASYDIGSSVQQQRLVYSPQLDKVFLANAELTVKSIPVTAAASGDNVVIAAGPGGTLNHVMGGVLIAAADVTVQFYSGSSAGTALSGPMLLKEGAGFSIPIGEYSHMIGLAAEAIILNLSASVSVGGWLLNAQSI